MSKKFKTKKKFGQHLLIAQGVIEKIVDFAEIKPEDIVVEIGVGTGQLTQEILKRNPKKLYGIEIDKTAYPIIEEKFASYENFELIKEDVLKVNLFELAKGQKIKVIGNLPYNISSLILVNCVFYIDVIERTVFMLQKEVAEKLTAKPKTKAYTFLSVFIQTFFEVEYLMSVPARFFSPPPKVTSAVVRMFPKKDIPSIDKKEFKNFVSALFSGRRKMLRKKLDRCVLERAGINPTARVEELEVKDFLKLYEEKKRCSSQA